jgi:hypothetical protein
MTRIAINPLDRNEELDAKSASRVTGAGPWFYGPYIGGYYPYGYSTVIYPQTWALPAAGFAVPYAYPGITYATPGYAYNPYYSPYVGFRVW